MARWEEGQGSRAHTRCLPLRDQVSIALDSHRDSAVGQRASKVSGTQITQIPHFSELASFPGDSSICEIVS